MEKRVIPFGFIFACLHTSIVASKFVSTMDEISSSGVRFNRVVWEMPAQLTRISIGPTKDYT